MAFTYLGKICLFNICRLVSIGLEIAQNKLYDWPYCSNRNIVTKVSYLFHPNPYYFEHFSFYIHLAFQKERNPFIFCRFFNHDFFLLPHSKTKWSDFFDWLLHPVLLFLFSSSSSTSSRSPLKERPPRKSGPFLDRKWTKNLPAWLTRSSPGMFVGTGNHNSFSHRDEAIFHFFLSHTRTPQVSNNRKRSWSVDIFAIFSYLVFFLSP